MFNFFSQFRKKEYDIPNTGLGLALQQAFHELAFKKKHPALQPFIHQDNSPLSLGTKQNINYARYIENVVSDFSPLVGFSERSATLKLKITDNDHLYGTHIFMLFSFLEEELPGITVFTKDLSPSNDFAHPIRDTYTMQIDRDSLLDGFKKTKNECFKRTFKELKTWCELFYHATNNARDCKTGYKRSSFLAASLATKTHAINTAFSISKLYNIFKYSHGPDRPLSFIPELHRPAVSSYLWEEKQAKNISRFLKAQGITKVSFHSSGLSSLAFQPEETKAPHMKDYIVVLSPHYQSFPDTPFHLPPIQMARFDKVLIRLMPKLQKLDDNEANRNIKIVLAKLNLPSSDLMEGNAANYSYVNQAGRTITVPMIYDWNAGPYNLPIQKREILFQTPELEPWVAAHRHIKKQAVQYRA